MNFMKLGSFGLLQKEQVVEGGIYFKDFGWCLSVIGCKRRGQ